MAKPRQKVKKAKKTSDPLAIALNELAIADRQTARAIRSLSKAILETVEEPSVEDCKFVMNGTKYRAKLTTAHCQAIMAVVDSNGDVLGTVGGLLGSGVNQQVVQCIAALTGVLTEGGEIRQGTKVALGCCSYDGGQTSYLSQAQCLQYPDATWDQNHPNCSELKPPPE
jgi:hypothetical protein